jgi:hypothetical protein
MSWLSLIESRLDSQDLSKSILFYSRLGMERNQLPRYVLGVGA